MDSENFKQHLASRGDDIKRVISAIYSKAPAASPDVQALQKRVNELLAQEKGYINEGQRLNEEIVDLNKQLEDASFRYMVAERKLDRVKSNVVANIEKQGTLGSSLVKPEAEEKVNGEPMNGVIKSETPPAFNEEAEREKNEAVAVANKAKEQLAQLEEQNSKLTKDLTTAKSRLESLSDEDYAGTELFKIMKSQLEESLNKINDLEAIHIRLRDEAKQAQAERTAYRTKVDEEAMISTSSTEQLLAARDADLQRVRAARDDAHFKFQSLDTLVHDHKATAESATALANARGDRVTALENEVERLRIRCGEINAEISEDLESSSVEELRQKVADLRRECKTLESELPSIEQAYKKAQAAAAAKYASYEQMDQQLSNLKIAKGRADQKYFGMMKYKEQLEAEVATLRRADRTSSGIIASLKNAEAQKNELAINFERQVAEHVDAIERLSQERFGLEAKAREASLAAQGLQKQVLQLKESLSEKDSALSITESSSREIQREVEALKVKLEDQTKQNAKLKKDAGKNDTEEITNLRVCEMFSAIQAH